MKVRFFCGAPAQWRPEMEYALAVLLEGVGYPAEATSSPSAAHIAYAPSRPQGFPPQGIWIVADCIRDWNHAIVQVATLAGVPYLYQQCTPCWTDAAEGVIAGDIVYSTYALVTGAAERDAPRDAWGVVVAGGWGLQQSGVLDFPCVAAYCDLLRRLLRSRFPEASQPVPLWPEGKKRAIVLSHDVDNPFCSLPPTLVARQLAYALKRRRAADSLWNLARLCRSLVLLPGMLLRPGRDPNFGFARWLEVERSLGARSAFYVAVERSTDAMGHPNDVGYDFRSGAMRQALARVTAEGWEVGLHASINSRHSRPRIAQQIDRLQEILPGYRVRGCRHHYWALDGEMPERTLWHHSEAGLQYDSSLGLNDAPGYRRGMCWPFTPYDREQRRLVPILEIPPTLMDGGIFCRDISQAEGKRLLREHLAKTFAAGGAVVLDWHVEQANPKGLRGAGPALIEALEDFRAEGDIYWASPAEVAAWWTERKNRMAACCKN